MKCESTLELFASTAKFWYVVTDPTIWCIYEAEHGISILLYNQNLLLL